MGFIQFINILWARRLIILLTTIACFGAAMLVIKILPPRYEANSRVMLDIVKPDPVTGQVISSTWARAYVKTQIELIRDYRVAGKVAEAAGWLNSPILANEFRQSGANKSTDFSEWLAQRVIDNTGARLIEGSNILEISYSSTSPEPAAKLADLLRDAYIEQTLAFRREAASENAEWFSRQTEKYRAQLEIAEKAKTEFERANGIILNEENIDADSSRLQALASASLPSQSLTLPPPVVGPAPSAAQLAALDATIAASAESLGPNHPEMKRLRERREIVAGVVADERTVMAANARRPTVSGPSLSSQYSSQQAKVLANAGKVGEAKRLATDVAVLRNQFIKSAARAAELEQEAESNESGLTLLGNAVAPQSPDFPKIPLITFGSLGFGFALGVLVSLLVELLGRRVRDVSDLALTGVPVIGAMAQDADKKPKRGIKYWLGFPSRLVRT